MFGGFLGRYPLLGRATGYARQIEHHKSVTSHEPYVRHAMNAGSAYGLPNRPEAPVRRRIVFVRLVPGVYQDGWSLRPGRSCLDATHEP